MDHNKSILQFRKKCIANARPYWRSTRKQLAYLRRQSHWILKYRFGAKPLFRFRCNICGRSTAFPRDAMSREQWSCVYCKSNVRWRSVIHALSTRLFGESLAIPDFPQRVDIRGIGLSDWEEYASRLHGKLDYTNTFYHREPFLDITSVDPSHFGKYDFLISSDVFEHICPPITKAFVNARRLLKPNGFMILTVPYVEGETREHFPEAHHFEIKKRNSKWVFVNETADGRLQEYSELTFHGGPGTTVEFRIFGKESLIQNCVKAGFSKIHIHDEDVNQFGIVWLPYDAARAPYHPPIYGLDTPPWVLANSEGGYPCEF